MKRRESFFAARGCYPVRLFRALRLTLAIVRKPWGDKTDDPFDNIDIRTAWAVGAHIWLR